MQRSSGARSASAEATALTVRAFAVGVLLVSGSLLFVALDQDIVPFRDIAALTVIGLSLHVAFASLPWQWLLDGRIGPWLLRAYVLGIAAVTMSAEQSLEPIPWPVLLLPALTLILTATVLTAVDHAIATALVIFVLVAGGRSSLDALSLTVLVSVITIGSLAWGLMAASLRRTWARIDSDRERAAAEARRLQIVEDRREHALGTIAHEIKNRLNVVAGCAETLAERADALSASERDRLARTASDHARTVSRTVDALEHLVRADHLDRSRLEDVPLAPLVTDVVDTLRPRSGDHRLVVDVPDDLRVRGDPELLERVFHNLVANAVRHTPPGTVVEVRADPSEDGRVRVAVVDDGPGIAPEDRDRIVEPFVRGQGAAPAPDDDGLGRSLGLGLALVARALDAQGAELEVGAPATGTGASFSFVLRRPRTDR